MEGSENEKIEAANSFTTKIFRYLSIRIRKEESKQPEITF